MATDEEVALLDVLTEEILFYQISELLPEQRVAANLEVARCSAALIPHILLRHDSAAAGDWTMRATECDGSGALTPV
ncbi:hypothetical protein ACIOJ9_29080 [Streptomyces sp. NPDC088175]|uniref:hypothetical protein n=1 Tax=unclassified Streptomyces TaxID=2593676 RepID=UPI003826EFBB